MGWDNNRVCEQDVQREGSVLSNWTAWCDTIENTLRSSRNIPIFIYSRGRNMANIRVFLLYYIFALSSHLFYAFFFYFLFLYFFSHTHKHAVSFIFTIARCCLRYILSYSKGNVTHHHQLNSTEHEMIRIIVIDNQVLYLYPLRFLVLLCHYCIGHRR